MKKWGSTGSACTRRADKSAWCWCCYANRKRRSNFRGHAGYQASPRPVSASWSDNVQRPTTQDSPGRDQHPVAEDALGVKCPLLVQHLSDVLWDDGKPRTPSTLTIFVEDGRVKLALNDREASASLYVAGDSLKQALGSLEKALSGPGRPDWRAWKGKRK